MVYKRTKLKNGFFYLRNVSMLPILFLKGWLIGFSIAMPVGPIGMLCVRHSLLGGMMCGLASGMGVALADAIYGAIAGFGVSIITSFLIANQTLFHIFGAIFLLYLGFSTFFGKKEYELEGDKNTAASKGRVFFTTFILTLTNPMTFISFTGIYAGLGIGYENVLSSIVMTWGVFIGSAAWWLILSFSLSFLRKKMNYKPTRILNRISGGFFLVFGGIATISAIHRCICYFQQ